MQKFDVYARHHRDGDAMLMIRNQNTCRALIKTPNGDYVEEMRDRVTAHIERSTNKLDVVMRYYRVAHKRDIYKVAFI